MASALLASLFHPSEIAAMIRYKLTVSDAAEKYKKLSSVPPRGSPSHSHAMCYYFLNQTSRSFARVIQELTPELAHPVCIFYLVLRGADTVEDDMTLPLERKCEVLRDFHKLIYQRGWTFSENGPNEKDRILMERFDVVIDEFLKLKESYQIVIADIAKRMGAGMAEFCEGKKVVTMEDYNLYTHYVAGLVGLGLTGLFTSSGLEDSSLSSEKSMELANTMGLFLQKVNITKDFLEDLREGRRFWPKDIWGRHVRRAVEANGGADEIAKVEEAGLEVLARGENLKFALACLNDMCVNALECVPHCLEYMSKLREPTVIHFCAIPQVMAIASISLFFNNPAIFTKTGTKIRRGLAVELIYRGTTFQGVKEIFLEYSMEIARKNAARVGTNDVDDSFWKMSTACSNIVRWIQIHDQKVNKVTRSQKSGQGASSSFLITILILILALIFVMSLFPVVA
ncbi:bifunctional farnesyl-diphosphate farnesyltransferase/squalene synthase [Blyttiomyces sp. JEL0837]|nr:bifunctional farnesyl-diphosphate farnesyltransferase/squalene synthase [Blyttiomyces sp. JEL0837]